MAQTTDITVQDDAWSVLAAGSPSVTVQLKSRGKLHLVVAQSTPAADSAEGIFLWSGGETVFAGNALAAADNVYAKSAEGPLVCAVMATS